jgi:hypothetical protein
LGTFFRKGILDKERFVEKAEEAVKKAKKNREWQSESMTLSMRDKENQEIGGYISGIIMPTIAKI